MKTEDIIGVDKQYYKNILDRIVTTRERGVGVRLSFHTDIAAAYVDIAPDLVVKKSEAGKLSSKIQEWAEQAVVDDYLEIDKLALNDSEIREIKETFAGTENIFELTVTTKNIKVLKVS